MDDIKLWFPYLSGIMYAVLAFSFFFLTQPLHAQAVIEWESLNNGLQGGTIEALWQSPEGTFFAGGSNSSLFRSPALGEPWEPVELGKHQALDFTTDPHGHLYLQTKERIFKSIDDGLTWADAGMDLPLWPLLFRSDGSVIGQFEHALYRRQENATEWEFLKEWTTDDFRNNGDLDRERIYVLKMTPTGTLIAGAGSQFFVSEDGTQWDCVKAGTSDTCIEGQWLSLSGGWPAPVASAILLDNLVLLHTQGTLATDGVIYDPEERQTISGSTQLPCGAVRSKVISTSTAYYARSRACCTMGFCSGMGFYRLDKNDPTYTWEFLFWNSEARTYLVAENESWICEGSGSGVRCTFDGGESWEPWNEGLDNVTTTSFFFQQNGDVIAGTQYGMKLTTGNPSTEWQPLSVNFSPASALPPTCTNPLAQLIQHSDGLFYGLVGSDVYQSLSTSDLFEITEASRTCFGLRGPGIFDENPDAPLLPICTPRSLFYADSYECIPLHQNQVISVDSSLYYTRTGKIYRSDDGFNDHLSRLSLPDSKFIHMVMAASKDNTLLVGRGPSLLIAVSKGESWLRRDLPDPEITILDITSPADSIFILGTNKGIYRTQDRGLTWDQPLESARCFNRIASNEKGIVLAGDRFLSRDYGETWEPIANPLPGSISSLAFDANGLIYAGTLGKGIYRSQQPIFTGSDAAGLTHESLAVDIFPNPAQSAIQIEIDVAQNEAFQAILYDILGRRIDDIHSATLVRGKHRLHVNLPNVPPGVYFIRLQSGDKLTSRSITVL